MPLNIAMWVMSAAEFLLWAALGYLFWSKQLHKRFPAMSKYLAIHVVSTPVLELALWAQAQPWGTNYFLVYFGLYWTVYIAAAVTLFFVCSELFRTALASFSGLMRFGLVIFRWAAVASAIASIASISFSNKGVLMIPEIAVALMRSVSILELCLLAFLCIAMNALQLSPRDLCFGISLGFGLLSANDFIEAALLPNNASLTSPAQFVHQAILLAGVAMWTAYVALPEPARKPIVVAANSTIYRWNEIASALGHKGTKVAVPATANSFFLSDVEKVVDKVLTRTLRETETGS